MDQGALALTISPAMLQDKAEISRLASIFKAEGVSSFLEIGSNHGGSLWTLGQVLPAGGRVVAVDIPEKGEVFEMRKASLLEVAADLRVHPGLDVHVIYGDSTHPDTLAKVELLGFSEGMFDAVFIDADHSLPSVTKDWENYGRLAKKLVAFHDIAWWRELTFTGKGIEVPLLWAGLKERYRHEEIKLCPTGRNNGIGVLWVA